MEVFIFRHVGCFSVEEALLVLLNHSVYLRFVWLRSFDEVIVPRFLLLVSLHAERLVIFPQMRTRTCCVAPRPLWST